MQLILGTAEFGKAYGEGVKEPPSEQEVVKILNLAWEAGIKALDTADTYGLDKVRPYFGRFGEIYKTRDLKDPKTWYHYQPFEIPVKTTQASVYNREQLEGLNSVIVPLSIGNTEFAYNLGVPTVYARSVFNRGKLLKDGYTVRDCISFVKRHSPNGIIVGVNSVQELEEILKVW